MAGVDKLMAPIGGRPLLAWTVEAMAASANVDRVVLVVAPEGVDAMRAAPWLPRSVWAVVAGGASRNGSAAAGVRALDAADPDGRDRPVLVHDGARPLVSVALVDRVIEAVIEHGAALPVLPVAETLKRVGDGLVLETVDRATLAAAQTPQGARRDILLRAWQVRPPEGPPEFTDEAALLEACTIPVHAISGESTNLKVTLPDDLRRVEWALAPAVPRVGFGHDSHPFGPGTGLRLGGIEIEGAPRLAGHSDGDVVLHAVADALLGAAGLGDLGRVFPADARTPKGIASDEMLREVRRQAGQCRHAARNRGHRRDRRPSEARESTRPDAGRDRAGAWHRRGGGQRQGVNRQSRRGRGRGPVDLGAGRRHGPGHGMTIHLGDTLTGEVRPLEPLEPGHVRIYSCGPTVYGPAHIGNFRSFLFADLLVRYLRYRGLAVTWAMNLTDIDDKIIRGAAAEGISTTALADRYTERFLVDADSLGMTRPDILPRATGHIPQIADLVATLVAKGHAYPTADGSIFFRIASWPAYGRLARLDPASMRVGERVEADEYGKDDVRDFVLWKGPKPGEPDLGHHRGCRTAGLAHRVLGDGHGALRCIVRHPHGRRGPRVPSPRGRDRPV